jgi:hypothetical protein
LAKSAEIILQDYETQRLKNKLLEFPGLIKAQKQKIRLLRDTFKDADAARAIIEADLATDINAETDPNSGKAKYSNEKARAAELMKRKAANEDFKVADKQARQAGYTLGEAEDELEALQDKYRSYRYVVRLVSAELELMAGDVGGEMAGDESRDGSHRESNIPQEPY